MSKIAMRPLREKESFIMPWGVDQALFHYNDEAFKKLEAAILW
jgi:hypothetical protein